MSKQSNTEALAGAVVKGVVRRGEAVVKVVVGTASDVVKIVPGLWKAITKG
jgi:phosphotransferase system IIB component